MTSPLYDMLKAIAECQESLTPAMNEEEVLVALAKHVCDELHAKLEAATCSDYLAAYAEAMEDDIRLSFRLAEAAREDRRNTLAFSRADYARDMQ